MDLAHLLTCCFIFIGPVDHHHSVCEFELHHDVVDKGLISNTYYVHPTGHYHFIKYDFIKEPPYRTRTTTPVCFELWYQMLTKADVVPAYKAFHRSCTHRYDLPVAYNDYSEYGTQERVKCVDSPQPYWHYGESLCSWSCVTRDSFPRLTIYNASCDDRILRLPVVDHSGFGAIVSRVFRFLLDNIEHLVSVILRVIIREITTVASALVADAYVWLDRVVDPRIFTAVLAICVAVSQYPGLFPMLVIPAWTLAHIKLNYVFH